MQFGPVVDTAEHEIPPFGANPDTLAKWIFIYAGGKGFSRQTEDSQYEVKRYYLNKKTRRFDDFIFNNMSKHAVVYNDYANRMTRHVAYFFDVKYIIEDSLPKYRWTLFDEQKTILSHSCKRASARSPVDRSLVFDAWYTEEIPLSCGPMDLNGLPGLILEVTRNHEPFYKVLSIKKLADSAGVKIEKPEPGAKSLSLQEYHKIRYGVPFVNENTKPPVKKN